MRIIYVASIVAFFLVCFSEAKGAKYQEHDEVPLLVNKVGPYRNPSEAYEYYDLPFCRPSESAIQHKHSSLGEDLSGDHKVTSLYKIFFKDDNPYFKLCKIHLTKDEQKQFVEAIQKDYLFEMFLDDLPFHGFVGMIERAANEGETDKYFLYKHMHLHILYNKDQVIYVNVTQDRSRAVELNADDDNLVLDFSYSADWEVTDIPYNHRHELLVDPYPSEELEIHWLSILNSFVLVLLLTGFLAVIIMRILKRDYNRYQKANVEDDDQEDYGWKLVHGDVFRFPVNSNLFCALNGLGLQLLSLLFGILLLALLGRFYSNSGGAIFTAGIVLYALTSIIGGFASASLYKQMGGEAWAWNIVFVATFFTIPLITGFAYVNTVAIVYHATVAVPFTAILLIVVILLFVGFPLTVIGGIAGRRSAGPFEAPCRTKNFPREIPVIPWYRSLPVQMVMSGFLPFSAIYIELYYVFSSMWGRSTYQLFGILFLVFIILVIVTACITIALTYFQLSMENHRWWWSSFFSGGSTGIFIFFYTIFYYSYRSSMTGALQSSFYFVYMFLMCYFFFLMLGAAGFYSSLMFVKNIYRNIKVE